MTHYKMNSGYATQENADLVNSDIDDYFNARVSTEITGDTFIITFNRELTQLEKSVIDNITIQRNRLIPFPIGNKQQSYSLAYTVNSSDYTTISTYIVSIKNITHIKIAGNGTYTARLYDTINDCDIATGVFSTSDTVVSDMTILAPLPSLFELQCKGNATISALSIFYN